jgi:hypothetical protein
VSFGYGNTDAAGTHYTKETVDVSYTVSSNHPAVNPRLPSGSPAELAAFVMRRALHVLSHTPGA